MHTFTSKRANVSNVTFHDTALKCFVDAKKKYLYRGCATKDHQTRIESFIRRAKVEFCINPKAMANVTWLLTRKLPQNVLRSGLCSNSCRALSSVNKTEDLSYFQKKIDVLHNKDGHSESVTFIQTVVRCVRIPVRD